MMKNAEQDTNRGGRYGCPPRQLVASIRSGLLPKQHTFKELDYQPLPPGAGILQLEDFQAGTERPSTTLPQDMHA